MRFGLKLPLQAPADEGKGGAAGGAGSADAGAGNKGGSADAGKADAGAPGQGAGDAGKKSVLSGAGQKDAESKDKGAEGESKGEGAKGEEKKGLELGKLPDGFKLDEKAWGEFKPVAEKVGLNQEQATALVQFYADRRAADTKASQDAWDQLRGGWYDSLKNDKEFGGAKFDENVTHAQKGLVWAGGKELAAELEKYGLDSHPGIAKAFAKVGRELAEDSSSTENDGAKGPGASRDAKLRAMYPSLYKKSGTK